MDLGNLVKIVVHHLLIEGMTCLDRWDGFPMVSTQTYVMHTGQDLWWIMTQDYKLSWFTKLLYCMDSQPWRILSQCQNQQETLTYRWNLKVVIYAYGLGHYWWRLLAIGILKWHMIIKFMVIIISLMEFDKCSLDLEYWLLLKTWYFVACN